MAGLTSTGFETKTTDDVLQELQRDQQAGIASTVSAPGSSEELNQSSASVLGNINGPFAQKVAELWALGLAIWAAFRASTSGGSALTALSLITGTQRQAATYSICKGVGVTLNAGATLPAGSKANVLGDPTRVFASKVAVTNSGGAPATVFVDFQAVNPGPVLAPAGTLTAITTAVAGWTAVNNGTDAIAGLANETDLQLRARRAASLSAEGSGSPDAIRAGILKNLSSNVTNCRVLANDGDMTDTDGDPSHSIEVIARGILTDAPSTTALCQQIALLKDAGTRAYGQTGTQAVLDSQGNTINIGYTWATEEDVYIDVTVTVDDTYPADGDAQVAAAIAAVGSSYDPGDPVIAMRLRAACFNVQGVTDVPALTLGFAPMPVGTANLTTNIRQFAALDTSRIAVTS